MELAIDTSTRYASVGVSEAGESIMQVAWRSAQNHSVELTPAIRRLLNGANVDISRIEAVFVAGGPGGFSALRVGIGTAKALAVAQRIPLVGVGTLDVEAGPYLGADLPVCAVIGAGRQRLYAGFFSGTSETPAQYQVVSHEELASVIEPGTLLCGEAARDASDALGQGLDKTIRLSRAPPPTRSPAVLADLGYRRLKAGDADDPDTFEPTYMRGSQYERAERRRVKAS